jgi:uncharacterized protein with PQ loop repeat
MHEQPTHHHLHQRKRTHLQKQKYPHPHKKVRFLDNICIVFSVLMPATTIPQILIIYKHHQVDGLSLTMWLLYCVGVIPFLIYAIVHKEKPLIILNILWLIAQIVIITGILIYR